MIPVTVGMLTYNSAATLERALASVAGCAQVLIADGGSTDDTLAISARHGADVIPQLGRGPIADFAAERNNLLDHATQPWFLSLDSDETATPELLDAIAAIARADRAPLVYRMPMGMTFNGREITAYSSLPGYQHRFFAVRSGARWIKPIHERIAFPTQETGTLQEKWYIHWDDARLRTDLRHLRSDAALGATQPLPAFLRFKIWRNLLGIAWILFSVARARLTTRWSACAPLRMEWQRIRYKALHMAYAVGARYR